MRERGEFEQLQAERIVGEAVPVVSEQIPEEYQMYVRNVRLLSGAFEPAYYSIRRGRVEDPRALEETYQALRAGFMWALQVEEFLDHETADDDRSQEIGNMMSYGLSQGLTEEQVMACYKQAYQAVTSDTRQ